MSDGTRDDRRDAGATDGRAADRDERMEGEMPNEEETIDAADAVPPDDLLDARIARLAAAHYHRPPDIVPRDAMVCRSAAYSVSRFVTLGTPRSRGSDPGRNCTAWPAGRHFSTSARSSRTDCLLECRYS